MKRTLIFLFLFFIAIVPSCAMIVYSEKPEAGGDYTVGTVVELRNGGTTVVFEDLDHQGQKMLLDSDYELKVGDHVDYQYYANRGFCVNRVLTDEEYDSYRELHDLPLEHTK